MPKRVKFRKSQRGKIRGVAQRGNQVSFGEFGLQSLTPAWIPANVIEACRVAAVRGAPEGRLFIRIFPHKPVTARPPETRMGKGKGAPEFWVAVVYPGTMLFEVAGVNEALAREACRLAANKLGVRTRFVVRHGTH